MSKPDAEESGNADAGDPEWRGVWSVLGYRWMFHIIQHLSEQDAGFNDIRRKIDGLNANTLSTRLECLQDEQLISRTVTENSPPSVTYSLTEKGRDFAAIVEQIAAFENQYE